MSSVRSRENRRIDDTFQHKCELQEKALCQWERQQKAWTRMQENLRRRIGPRGGTNMSESSHIARIRAEDLSLINRASPQGLFVCPEAWPSTLRSNHVDGAVRYVKLGRSDFPYPLYTKLLDKRRSGPDSYINARVVFPGQSAPLDKKNINAKRRNQSSEVIDNEEEQDDDDDDDEMKADVEVSSLGPKSASLGMAAAPMETPLFIQRSDGYYKKQLQRQEEFLREHVPHLLLPRGYLELFGGPPPCTMSRDDWAAAESKVPPVTCVPPPAPPEQPKEPVAIKAPSTRSASASATHPVTSTVETKAGMQEGPYLEVSTTRVLFIARPGELAHGTAIIRNGGTTTVYYTWVPLDPNPALGKEAEEEQRQEDAKSTKELNGVEDLNPSSAHLDKGDNVNEGDGNGQENVGKVNEFVSNERKSPKVTIGSKLRALSSKSKEARDYFYFSSPMDGVILPGEEGEFSFSVRSPFPGRFTQHYEILMIPVIAPLVIELCAIVCDTDLSTYALARPIATTIDARAIADVQRHTINAIAADSVLYEASEIRQATKAHLNAASAAERASRAQLMRWRAAWQSANHTALSLPFNRDVYARLDALHGKLVQALSTLRAPLPPHAHTWDGSVLTLQAHLCRLRDAHARNTMREALAVLLRAACVSEREDEALAALLLRLAGGEALAEIARRAGDAEEAAEVAVGLRAPAARPAAPGRKSAALAPRPSARPGGRAKAAEEAADASSTTDPADPAVQEERAAWLFVGMRRVVGDAVDRLCASYDSARLTVEAACHEPLLEVTESARAKDVHTVQAAEDMEVDHTVDIIPVKRKR